VGLLHALGADLAALLELVELLLRVVLVHLRHHLHDIQQPLRAGFVGTVERGGEADQALSQASLELELPLHALDVPPERRAQVARVAIESGRHLRERQLELTQTEHLIEPTNIRLVIEAMPCFGAARRREQPDLVVVMKSSNSHARRRGKLADPPALCFTGAG
jgi:hypothetical protein